MKKEKSEYLPDEFVELMETLEKLEEENKFLKTENKELKKLEEENKKLKAELELKNLALKQAQEGSILI